MDALSSSNQFFSDRVPAGDAANELLLRWAVFTDGLQRYSTLAADPDAHYSEEFSEEEAWLLDDDREWPFSFVNLSEAFGFQTASLRASLLARKELHSTNGADAEHKKKILRGFSPKDIIGDSVYWWDVNLFDVTRASARVSGRDWPDTGRVYAVVARLCGSLCRG
ncbi:MAG: hypothetical protein EXR78_09260, partial [Deltaproteobacteria bacterium]|nr:hypothetical protein [Deltaproteobacteria bacterium]